LLQECKVERKYGVESTTSITLFSPQEFFGIETPAAEEEEAAAAVAPDAATAPANATATTNAPAPANATSNATATAPEGVQAASGPNQGSTTTITANGTSSARYATASNWYKLLMNAKENGGGWAQLPKLMREKLVTLLKDMTVQMAIDYKPVNQ
jgi:hypothetical protein